MGFYGILIVIFVKFMESGGCMKLNYKKLWTMSIDKKMKEKEFA